MDDFETPAARQQWIPCGGADREEGAPWSTNDCHSPATCLAIDTSQGRHSGGWESPPFSVQSGQYYRLTLFSRSQGGCFAAAQFSDENGAQTEGDSNWGIVPSKEWSEQVFCFKPKFSACTGSIRLYPAGSTPLWIDDVRVESVDHSDVCALADVVYATMPPVPAMVFNALETIPFAAVTRLKEGRSLRVLLLGDSISNDLDNSAFDALLERAFPGTQVNTIFAGRGGTGWVKLRHQIRERVLPHQPHLVILLAVSNDTGHLSNDLTETVRAIRQESPRLEVLLVSPHLSSWGGGGKTLGGEQRDIIRQVACDEKTSFFDLFQVWQDYQAVHQQPEAWLLRDGVHMNERGRQLTARAAVTYFLHAAGVAQPDGEKP